MPTDARSGHAAATLFTVCSLLLCVHCVAPKPAATLGVGPGSQAGADQQASADADTAAPAPADAQDAAAAAEVAPPKPCAQDKECGGGFCVDAVCAACRASSDCTAPNPCINGVCVAKKACSSDKACLATSEVCNKAAGYCVPCTTDAECGADLTCKANHCVGAPASCKTSKDCGAELVCDKAGGVCAECIDDGDCAKSASCQQAYCVPDVCVAKTSTCADATTQKVCADNGAQWQTQACAAGMTCSDGSCQAPPCNANALFCVGDTIYSCAADGKSSAVKVDCAASQPPQSCSDGACKDVACAAGQSKCQGSSGVITCGADGKWTATACPSGSSCSGGKCAASVCQAGAKGCDGAKTTVCQADGSGWVTVENCAAKGSACVGGACVATAACTAGEKVCNGSALKVCAADGKGWVEQSCDDGKPCTVDTCSLGACQHLATSGAACDDGDPCTGPGTCDGGKCNVGSGYFGVQLGFGNFGLNVLLRLSGGDWLAHVGDNVYRVTPTGAVKWTVPVPKYSLRMAILPNDQWMLQDQDKGNVPQVYAANGLPAGKTWQPPNVTVGSIAPIPGAVAVTGVLTGTGKGMYFKVDYDAVIQSYIAAPYPGGSLMAMAGSANGYFGVVTSYPEVHVVNPAWTAVTVDGTKPKFGTLANNQFSYAGLAVGSDGTAYVVGLVDSPPFGFVAALKDNAALWSFNAKVFGLQACGDVAVDANGDVVAVCVVAGGVAAVVRLTAGGALRSVATIGFDKASYTGQQIEPTAGGVAILVEGKLNAVSGNHLLQLDAFGNASCAESGACSGKKASDCDDGNPCTNDLCTAAAGCTHQPFPNGLACGPPDKVCKNSVCF